MSKKQHKHIADALTILADVGMPKEQINERSALCLLALVDIKKNKEWKDVSAPLMGITPMMDFSFKTYGKKYAPNSRETFRRFTIHQFVQAGLAMYNPDEPERPVNSPKAVYQISPEALGLLKSYGTSQWNKKVKAYRSIKSELSKKYAAEHDLQQVPVKISGGKKIKLSPGEHSKLIKAIVDEFASRFVPGAVLIYVGDTGEKWGYFDEKALAKLGVTVDFHGKMPDVVVYYPKKKWLILVESVTSHGPMDAKRHEELKKMFSDCTVGLVFVTAFPTKSVMTKYLSAIAWETEVWVAESPSHLIHFNGIRFLGPYPTS
jgi:hypothetical protein